jgi:hypothetical protein
MNNTIISQSTFLTLESYDRMIAAIVDGNDNKTYKESMQPYILANQLLEQKIQKDISLNKKFFNAILKTKLTSLCLITEPWCLDACILLPLLRAVEIANENIRISIAIRDQNEDLMNQFLTNGSKSIPILFGLDVDSTIAFRWGPRGAAAQRLASEIKDAPLEVKIEQLTDFYLQDLTQEIQEEWIGLLNA